MAQENQIDDELLAAAKHPITDETLSQDNAQLGDDLEQAAKYSLSPPEPQEPKRTMLQKAGDIAQMAINNPGEYAANALWHRLVRPLLSPATMPISMMTGREMHDPEFISPGNTGTYAKAAGEVGALPAEIASALMMPALRVGALADVAAPVASKIPMIGDATRALIPELAAQAPGGAFYGALFGEGSENKPTLKGLAKSAGVGLGLSSGIGVAGAAFGGLQNNFLEQARNLSSKYPAIFATPKEAEKNFNDLVAGGTLPSDINMEMVNGITPRILFRTGYLQKELPKTLRFAQNAADLTGGINSNLLSGAKSSELPGLIADSLKQTKQDVSNKFSMLFGENRAKVENLDFHNVLSSKQASKVIDSIASIPAGSVQTVPNKAQQYIAGIANQSAERDLSDLKIGGRDLGAMGMDSSKLQKAVMDSVTKNNVSLFNAKIGQWKVGDAMDVSSDMGKYINTIGDPKLQKSLIDVKHNLDLDIFNSISKGASPKDAQYFEKLQGRYANEYVPFRDADIEKSIDLARRKELGTAQPLAQSNIGETLLDPKNKNVFNQLPAKTQYQVVGQNLTATVGDNPTAQDLVKWYDNNKSKVDALKDENLNQAFDSLKKNANVLDAMKMPKEGKDMLHKSLYSQFGMLAAPVYHALYHIPTFGIGPIAGAISGISKIRKAALNSPEMIQAYMKGGKIPLQSNLTSGAQKLSMMLGLTQ